MSERNDVIHARRPAPRKRTGALKFLADERGTVAVIAAVAFPVLVGAMGLGAETGFWYLKQRKLQHAADVAAHAAAGRLRAGDQRSALEATATQIASKSGYSPSAGTLAISPSSSPAASAGTLDRLEVVVTETRSRLFSSIFSDQPVTMRARAVAQVEGGSTACVLALSKTKSGAVTVSGSASVDLSGCDVASNSSASDSFLMSGSASMNADCVHAVGGAVATLGLRLKQCDSVHENAPASIDPYAGVAEPFPWAGFACDAGSRNIGNPGQLTLVKTTQMHPSGVRVRCFPNGLDVKGTVEFEPGLYIITGGTFTANGGNPTATSAARLHVGTPVNGYSGVTFFLANDARLDLRGNVSLDLKAPTSGPYSGILFFGSRSQTAVSHSINGTSNSVLTGAVYTPASSLDYKGNSATANGCTQVIADKITFSGNSTMQSACDSAGTKKLLANQRIALIE
ncbi:pilus assembly protein TadG-related protein [Sinorhizobium arboris]|uniref:pilus assembly protein TadG-related protein n=1 Tax=Sinorhizobium arboris TaxID=76745 RepID=UPI00042024E6|nr:pilus assembly protein TadG-related protein [Sinorhizobium arboris]